MQFGIILYLSFSWLSFANVTYIHLRSSEGIIKMFFEIIVVEIIFRFTFWIDIINLKHTISFTIFSRTLKYFFSFTFVLSLIYFITLHFFVNLTTNLTRYCITTLNLSFSFFWSLLCKMMEQPLYPRCAYIQFVS